MFTPLSSEFLQTANTAPKRPTAKPEQCKSETSQWVGGQQRSRTTAMPIRSKQSFPKGTMRAPSVARTRARRGAGMQAASRQAGTASSAITQAKVTPVRKHAAKGKRMCSSPTKESDAVISNLEREVASSQKHLLEASAVCALWQDSLNQAARIELKVARQLGSLRERERKRCVAADRAAIDAARRQHAASLVAQVAHQAAGLEGIESIKNTIHSSSIEDDDSESSQFGQRSTCSRGGMRSIVAAALQAAAGPRIRACSSWAPQSQHAQPQSQSSPVQHTIDCVAPRTTCSKTAADASFAQDGAATVDVGVAIGEINNARRYIAPTLEHTVRPADGHEFQVELGTNFGGVMDADTNYDADGKASDYLSGASDCERKQEIEDKGEYEAAGIGEVESDTDSDGDGNAWVQSMREAAKRRAQVQILDAIQETQRSATVRATSPMHSQPPVISDGGTKCAAGTAAHSGGKSALVAAMAAIKWVSATRKGRANFDVQHSAVLGATQEQKHPSDHECDSRKADSARCGPAISTAQDHHQRLRKEARDDTRQGMHSEESQWAQPVGGARVVVRLHHSAAARANGTVRFVGRTVFSGDEVVYGIELDEQLGEHNGQRPLDEATAARKHAHARAPTEPRYFVCREGHGVFATRGDIICVFEPWKRSAASTPAPKTAAVESRRSRSFAALRGRLASKTCRHRPQNIDHKHEQQQQRQQQQQRWPPQQQQQQRQQQEQRRWRKEEEEEQKKGEEEEEEQQQRQQQQHTAGAQKNAGIAGSCMDSPKRPARSSTRDLLLDAFLPKFDPC